MPDEVQRLYNLDENHKERSKISKLIKIFFLLLKRFRRMYIIIDALDECFEREDILDLIANIVNHKSEEINILATSRIERDIKTILQDILSSSICIQNSKIKEDISLHVRSRLSQDPKLRAWPDSTRKEIELILVEEVYRIYYSLIPFDLIYGTDIVF